MRTNVVVGALAALLSIAAPSARAALTSTVSAPGLAPGACSATSASGALSTSCSGGAFSDIAITASGPPLVAAPDLTATALTVTTGKGAFPETLHVSIASSGFTFGGGQVDALFTINNLIGTDAGPFTLSVSTPFGTESHTFTGAGSFLANPIALPADTNDAANFDLTFSGGGQSVDASIEFVGVPEPRSLALLGAGLFGLGLVSARWRSRPHRGV